MMNKMTLLTFAVMSGSLSFAQLSDIEIHGFISQGFMVSSDYNLHTLDSKDGTFEFNEVAINFSTELSENLRAGMQIMSRDFGDVGNNQVAIDWAYGDYSYRDWLGFRAGRVKTPVGLYNQTRDVDLVRTSVLLPQSVYNETYRDFLSGINGGEIYGMLPLGGCGSLQYTLQVGVADVDADNSGIKARFEAEGYSSVVPGTAAERRINDVDMDPAFNAALVWLTPVDGLRLGATANSFKFAADGTLTDANLGGGVPITLPMQVESERAMIYTASSELIKGDWVFAVEGIYTWYDMDVTVSHPTLGPLPSVLGYKSAAGYGSASYRLNELIELGSFYSFTRNMDDDAESHDLALSVRFDLTDSWVLKVEGHYLHGGSELIYPTNNDNVFNGNPDAIKDLNDEDWFMGAVKTTFSF